MVDPVQDHVRDLEVVRSQHHHMGRALVESHTDFVADTRHTLAESPLILLSTKMDVKFGLISFRAAGPKTAVRRPTRRR